MGNYNITSTATPTLQSLVTKNYVDTAISSIGANTAQTYLISVSGSPMQYKTNPQSITWQLIKGSGTPYVQNISANMAGDGFYPAFLYIVCPLDTGRTWNNTFVKSLSFIDKTVYNAMLTRNYLESVSWSMATYSNGSAETYMIRTWAGDATNRGSGTTDHTFVIIAEVDII
jgi:hypothetical protein